MNIESSEPVPVGVPAWEEQFRTTRQLTMQARTRAIGYATCVASSLGVGMVTLIDPALTTKTPAVATIVALLFLSGITIALSRHHLSIKRAIWLNSLLALTVLIHVEVLLTIHPGHEPPKLLLPLLLPIMAMCLPMSPREIIPIATSLPLIHWAFAPFTLPEHLSIELVLLGISIFFAFLSVHLGDQDRRQLAMSRVETLGEKQLLEQSNFTLEERVSERTKVAEERAQALKRLALELNRAEQRERQAIARTLHDDLQQVLAAVRLRLAGISLSPQTTDHTENETHLKTAEALLNEALETSRSLSVQLAPYALLDQGLSTALSWLCRQFQERYQLEIKTHLDERANPESNEMSTFLFHTARELLFNVVKHGSAPQARLKLHLSEEGQPLLEVYNSYEVASSAIVSADANDVEPITFGLPTIAHRIELMEGKMDVKTDKSGGFSVSIRLPTSS